MLNIPGLFKNSLDFLIPLRCIKCGSVVAGDQTGLCPQCWPFIPFISDPVCQCCGFPFEFDLESPEDVLCGPCQSELPLYKTARAVFAYTNQSKDMILKFKHLDSLHPVPTFAKWMARLGPYPEDCLCIPVPLHWTRLLRRTYNQAALLAQALSKEKNWLYVSYLLRRRRMTRSQGFLSFKERKRNVAGAFRIKQKHKERLKGKTIILVDDVFTTGATLNACTKTLLRAGAQEVHAITLSRVVKSRQASG